MSEKHEASKALVAANGAALRAFQTAITSAFRLTGPTLKSRLALQQLDTLVQEYDEVVATIERIELPEPAEGKFDQQQLESSMKAVFGDRAEEFKKMSEDTVERLKAAATEIARSIDGPLGQDPMNSENLAKAKRAFVALSASEQANLFSLLVEASGGGIVAVLFDRLQEKIANAPAAPAEVPTNADEPPSAETPAASE